MTALCFVCALTDGTTRLADHDGLHGANRLLTFDEAEAYGFDGTGRDLDPRFPYHLSDIAGLTPVPDAECDCGHAFAEHDATGQCTGTGATLDPIYGIPPDQECVCTAFTLPDDVR